MKKYWWFIVILAVIGFVVWFIMTTPEIDDDNVISRNGIHWHPRLSIKIKGEEVEMPANLGLGAVHNPIHTHENDGVLHLEFSGLVLKDHVKLGEFFKVWGKEYNRNCIFDYCAGEDGKLRMLVNGKESTAYGNYSMKDGDVIEILFD